MTDWIQNSVNDAAAALWAKLIGFLSLSFLDPFWHWALLGAAVIAVVCLVCYFFSSWLTFLRPIGGVIILLVTFGLYAYARGEREARDHDKPKRRRP